MTTSEIILMILVSAFLGSLIGIGLSKEKLNKKNKRLPKPQSPLLNVDFKTGLAILELIAIECIENRKFSLKVNDKTSLPPIDEEISYMVEKILTSMGGQLIKELEKYVSRKFIISYISRLVRDYCIDYIEEIRFGRNISKK